MAGIYLHIPFCKQACTYCNFHFSTSLKTKDELVRALVREAEEEKEYVGQETINTIYFGGGTPSILDESDIAFLLTTLLTCYQISPDVEVTLEANPDDITPQKLNTWKQLGINRLSIGVQSFFENELRWMNRAHNSYQAINSLELARKLFDNITIDLIYGSPFLSDEMWKKNVDQALKLYIPHLSCYALTVEEKTPLHKLIKTQKTPDVQNESQARQFLLLMEWLREEGYEHYEVSNFAKPGFRSRHNSSYWKGEKYLGLGPSAHSYNGYQRRWNIANNNQYIKITTENSNQRETETLTVKQRLNEYVMISLRTMEGMDLKKVVEQFGSKEQERIQKSVQKFITKGLVKMDNSILQLTDEGMLRADGIASELFA